jgi:hypothetical protein
MIDKYFNYIVLGFLILIIVQPFFSVPKGITEEEEIYRLKIHDLNQEKAILLQNNDSLNSNLKKLKDEYHKIDSITANYNNNQVDSFFTDFFNR